MNDDSWDAPRAYKLNPPPPPPLLRQFLLRKILCKKVKRINSIDKKDLSFWRFKKKEHKHSNP